MTAVPRSVELSVVDEPKENPTAFANDLSPLTPWIKASWDNAAMLWSGLTNVVWLRANEMCWLSFRGAGHMVAELYLGNDVYNSDPMAYMEFYLSARPGAVHPHVLIHLKSAGWTPYGFQRGTRRLLEIMQGVVPTVSAFAPRERKRP